ncbi:MAG TPA: SPFH domain-containing protein [Candidatus Binataceae bacterium]|nr:SPFH domain-containing protein [Candidatus Binataceae bacterium]
MKAHVMFAIAVPLFLGACSNPHTPAGYVGYVTKTPVFLKAHFYEVQVGPASTGMGWMLNVRNYSITPFDIDQTFEGDSAVLCKDNLKISFAVHVVMRLNPDMVRSFVERFESDVSNQDPVVSSFNEYFQEPLRTYARDAIQKYTAFDIKENIDTISKEIADRVAQRAESTPFIISTLVVGNIQYPPQVAEAVARKMAATQVLQQTQIEIETEKAKAQKRVVEARGIADAMEIVKNQLTPLYIQHEAIQAQEKMVGSPNHTEVYIPVGPLGVPLVNAQDIGRKE